MNLAGAAYHSITPSDNNTIRTAIDELDRFLVLAPDMAPASTPGAYPAWLLPSVNALVWKADCQRRLDDRIGAASTELRVATTFVAAGAPADQRLGGFLPEEAYYRAAVDYAIIGRPAEAAGCLASIRLLPNPFRPAGQHAWNAATSLGDAAKARQLTHETLRQLPLDDWTVIQIYYVARLTRGSEADTAACLDAIDLINHAIASGETNMIAASAAFARVKQQAGRAPDLQDQDAGFHALLLRTRSELEFDAGDLHGARATLQELATRGWLLESTATALERIRSRINAEERNR